MQDRVQRRMETGSGLDGPWHGPDSAPVCLTLANRQVCDGFK